MDDWPLDDWDSPESPEARGSSVDDWPLDDWDSPESPEARESLLGAWVVVVVVVVVVLGLCCDEIHVLNSHASSEVAKGPIKIRLPGSSRPSLPVSHNCGLTINACLPFFSTFSWRSVGRMPGEAGVATSANLLLSHFNVSMDRGVDVVVDAVVDVVVDAVVVVVVVGVAGFLSGLN